MQPFPHPSDATHKIWSRLADSPQRYSSLKVWTTTDGRRRRRRTDDGPLVYYKLTLWAFGSGELTTEKRWRHRFPHYKSMGAFCCHRNQSFDPICPETLCSLSPIPVMLHIKFNQDWPTGFRDIKVWKSGRWRTDGRTTTDGRTDDGPLVYYKLTLWAFGSGELKKWQRQLRLRYCVKQWFEKQGVTSKTHARKSMRTLIKLSFWYLIGAK